MQIEPLSVEDAMTAVIETQDAYRRALKRISVLEDALRGIAGNTYGTELCNTAEENLDIMFRHLRRHQEIARAALAPSP